MASRKSRGIGKQGLLDAAQALVSQVGVQALTLEGVAAAAGVTKGGLVYHFKTRDDLLAALIERMMGYIRERNQARAVSQGNTSRALVLALSEDTFAMPRHEKQLYSNLLAAISNHPHLLGPVRELFRHTYGQLAKDNSHPGLAQLLAAALDGITLLELLDLHRFTKAQHAAMRTAVERLASQLDLPASEGR